jgi:hypothetical protein
MDTGTEDDPIGLATSQSHRPADCWKLARSISRRNEMDVLQINYWDFFLQSVGLAAWVCVVAVIYSVIERAVEARHPHTPTEQ